MTQSGMTYAASGVNIDAASLFVTMIRDRIQKAWPQDLGLNEAGFAGRLLLHEPTSRVSGASDGSGTVAILAALTERFDVIGRNAAAMSLVDAYVNGDRPVGLLDVIDVAQLQPEKHIGIVEGLIYACECAGACRLIGGETAELPDMFRHSWMVNVNTTVIAVPEDQIVSGRVRPGQTVWGWRSDGPASNGFSLIRKVFDLKKYYGFWGRLMNLFEFEPAPKRALRRLERWIPDCNSTLADALLVPAPVWINQIEIQRKNGVRFAAHAHITGGGLVDNIPRVLPSECKVVLDRAAWYRPPVFSVIEREGRVTPREMDRTFNQGIMVVSILDQAGHEPSTPNITPIGEVRLREDGEPQVQFTGTFAN